MKRELLLGLGLLLSAGLAKAQFSPYNKTWSYSFGTTAKQFDVPASGNLFSETSAATETPVFLPKPTSGSVRALYSNAASGVNGKFNILATNELKITQGQASGIVKFSGYSIEEASDLAKFSFKIYIGNSGSNTGVYSVAMGNFQTTPGTFRNSSSVYRSTNEYFTSLRWVFEDGKTPTLQYRLGSDESSVTTNTTITGVNPVVGGTYDVDVFMNNTGALKKYVYTEGGSDVDLPNNTFHLYINGIKVGEDFSRSIEVTGAGGLAAGTSKAFANGLPLNTFMFIATGTATSTVADHIKVSNISYTYQKATLPVTLTSFTGNLNNNAVDLKWTTASEQNNSHFNILRSADSKNFDVLDRVEGHGTVNESKEYNYQDRNPLSGTNYYQLRQIDLDGKENILNRIVAVKTTLGTSEFTVFINQENQLIANIFSDNKSAAKIGLFDIAGNELLNEDVNLEKGNNLVTNNMPFLQKGVYVLRLASEGETRSVKFIK